MAEIDDGFEEIDPYTVPPMRRGGAAKAKPNGKGHTHGDQRAVIRIVDADFNQAVRDAARLLVDDLYLRQLQVAMLARAEAAQGAERVDGKVRLAGVEYAPGTLIFTAASQDRVQYLLNGRARFERYDTRTKAWLPRSCPAAIARMTIAAADLLEEGKRKIVRQTAGIVHVPLFMAGRIIAQPGYHAATGYLVEWRAGQPPVPNRPGKAEARAALDRLLHPFRGYLDGLDPEAYGTLRASLAAAVLTAVLRPSLPSAPIILIDANQPAAGKGKVARGLGVLATGRPPAVLTEGHSEDETEKRLAAAILSGAPAILLDNLQRLLASSTLESGLTEGQATIRLFGSLTDVTVPFTALTLITANNAVLRRDMLRRAMTVRIVVATETPELRRFDFDPVDEIQRDRLELVTAALTIAKAWWAVRETETNAAGKLIRNTTLGSFDHWADLVAGAVEWLTDVNPVDLIEARKAADPRGGDERAVIEALAAWQAGQPRAWWPAKAATTGIDSDLWHSVLEAKGDRPAVKQVANWLRARKDKVFADLQLSGRPDRKGVMEWTVRGLAG